MFGDRRCVLIADDEPRMLRALKDLLSGSGFYVLEAGDGGQALEAFFENNAIIDILLLDVMMPVKDGFEVLREIRRQSLVPAIMLTARGEEYDQLEGFRAGADDYISKPFSPSLLLARLDAVLKRAGKDRDKDITAGRICVSTIRREVTVDGAAVPLTPREFELLYFFTLNQEMILTREQLLDQVWGYDFFGDIRTVDTHVKQLRSKLGEAGDYIKTVYRVGYRFEVDK